MPIMSNANLTDMMPLIQKAVDSALDEDIIPNKNYETKEIAQRYTLKAIMSSGFGVGKCVGLCVRFGLIRNNSDPTDDNAMNDARANALNILPRNASLQKFMLLGMIPQWIRYALDYHLYPEYDSSEYDS